MKLRALPSVVARALLLVALALCSAASRAEAQADLLLGGWRQVASNAGKCPGCEIRFAMAGRALRVAANNGWSAVVAERARRGVIAAVGDGRWSGPTGRLAGKGFDVDFELRGDQLGMTMRIRHGAAMETVRALYERPWLGS
jgi:hypothetical protein